jgi:hypothetical protein
MNALMILHVAAGAASIAAGAVAVSARKGGRLHAAGGNAFAAAMMTMALTAALLVVTRDGGDERTHPAGSLFICYLVATGWWTGRNRAGTAGRFEIAACASAAALAAVSFVLGALDPRGGGAGPLFFTGALAALAAWSDFAFIRRGRLTGAQRLGRHIWRMCVAFFFATGAFFLGQQDVMPAAVRGSLWLFVPGLAPFGFMIFWMARLKFGRSSRRSGQAAPTPFDRLARGDAAAPIGA